MILSMKNITGNIIKKDDIKLEGTFRLDSAQSMATTTAKNHSFTGPTQVQIVENNAKFVVMEILCSCGTKTHVKCQYANIEDSADKSADQTNGESNNVQ